MNLVATRVYGVVTRTFMHDGDVVNVNREWVQSGRQLTKDDFFISRKTHAQLIRRGDALFLYNRHENRIRIIPGDVRVYRGETVRVDGHMIRIGRTPIGDVHLELDDGEDELCPPTPPCSQ